MAARSLNPKPAQRSAVKVEPAPQLLLASQLIFNIGFYAVVPFLAVAMRSDFGMGAMAIGIVLGARPSPSRACSFSAEHLPTGGEHGSR